MEPTDQSDKIEQYLLNQMDEGEKADFEKQINFDPSLAEDVKLQQDLFELSNDEDFNIIFPDIKAQDAVYHKSQQKSNTNWLLISVAFLVLAVLLFYFLTTKT